MRGGGGAGFRAVFGFEDFFNILGLQGFIADQLQSPDHVADLVVEEGAGFNLKND